MYHLLPDFTGEFCITGAARSLARIYRQRLNS